MPTTKTQIIKRKWPRPAALTRAVSLAAAGACMALSACGGGFADDAPASDIAPACGASRLGCATAHNIAALVDKPADLAAPRKQQPRDSMRRHAVLSAYAENRAEQTGSRTQGAASTQQEGARP